MTKAGRILAWAAVAVIVLSALAHTLLGWPGLRGQLELARVPDELLAGVGMVWFYGGLAMLLLAALLGIELRRPAPARAVFIAIGLGYTVFGVAELALTASAFPLVFVLPGALPLGAALTLRAGTA